MTGVFKTYQRLTLSIVNLVNAPRNIGERTRDAYAPLKERKRLITGVQQALDQNLIIGALSELSIRLPEERIIITPGNSWLPTINENDILYGNLSGDWSHSQDRNPLHLFWHFSVYHATEARAVILCQPSAAMAFMTQDRELNPLYLKEGPRATGGVIIVSSGEIQNEIENHAPEHGVMMLPGEGVLVWGSDIPMTLSRVEAVNCWCEIMLGITPHSD